MSDPFQVWLLDPANLTPYYCLTLAQALAEAGDQVHFITSPFRYDPGLAPPAGVVVEHHYFQRFRWLQQRGGATVRRAIQAFSYPLDHRRLLNRLRRNPPNVLHIQWSRLPVFDRRLVAAVREAGVPVVHTVHDVEPLFAGGVSKLEDVYSQADALIVHTEQNARELAERYSSVDPKRIHVIPHGPLQAEHIPAEADQRSARESLGVPKDARVALCFGGIRPYKGVDLLVQAFPKAAAQLENAWLILAGRPVAKTDKPDLSPLDQAGAHYLANFDFIANDEVWKYYLASDVVVLPYRRITQSGVLLSAMAHGRASVVTAVGGLPEVVAEQTGWVVPPEDVDALAEAIVQALTDRPKTLEMGQAAKSRVNSKYSWATIARRTHDLYASLASTSVPADRK